jgi:hypothetical protein
MTNYIYVLFGDEERHWMEFFYSLGTLLRHTDRADSRVVVFTDRPDKLKSAPVVYQDISGQVKTMKGPAGFNFRVKLCALLQCLENFSGNVVYFDGDTFITGDIAAKARCLDKGCALMWKQERLAQRMKGFDGFEMRLPDGSPYKYGGESVMYNAGVVGMHRDNLGVLQTALALCDGFVQHDPTNRLCEQFANCEAMRISGLTILETYDVVAHYYRASFRAYMHERLPKFNAQLSGPPWDFDRPIPASYARVQWAKLRKKWKF